MNFIIREILTCGLLFVLPLQNPKNSFISIFPNENAKEGMLKKVDEYYETNK